MPLTLTNPINAIPAVAAIQANVFEIIQFNSNVNPADSANNSLSIIYAAGNMVNGVFVQVGENRELNINGSAFSSFMSANPSIYGTLKPLLFGLIQSSENVSGIIS